jgi:sulfate transport system ATP-binding protein
VTSRHRSGSSRRLGLRLVGTGTHIEALAPTDRDLPPVGATAALRFRQSGLFPA